MDELNSPHANEVLSQARGRVLSPATREQKKRHFHWPNMCAYLVYDLSSPVFSATEIEAIFSPPLQTGSTRPSSNASSNTGNGWGTFLNSRMEYITHRSPDLKPTGICVGEYSSASVAHPCNVHGVGQIFHGWSDHPSMKRFKQMIASTPVIKPSGNGPAQILKAYLDEYNGSKSPLDVTWVMKFLLLPKNPETADRWWVTKDWQDLCQPDNLRENEFKPVALICVREDGFRRDDLSKKLIEFGKLFYVEVMIVSSIG